MVVPARAGIIRCWTSPPNSAHRRPHPSGGLPVSGSCLRLFDKPPVLTPDDRLRPDSAYPVSLQLACESASTGRGTRGSRGTGLVTESWRLCAPKRLLAAYDAEHPPAP